MEQERTGARSESGGVGHECGMGGFGLAVSEDGQEAVAVLDGGAVEASLPEVAGGAVPLAWLPAGWLDGVVWASCGIMKS